MRAAILLSLLLVPMAAAENFQLYVHGSAEQHDTATGAPDIWMDATGPGGTDRTIVSHSAGTTTFPNPVEVGLLEPFADALLLGDGDPSTAGPETDFVAITACVQETTQTAFVPRLRFQLLMEGNVIGERLSNDLEIPYNVPQCITVNVPLNQYVDDQAPEGNNEDLGVPRTASGDILVPAGTDLRWNVDVDTVLGGPTWTYWYDSADYPANMAFAATVIGGSEPGAPETAPETLFANIEDEELDISQNFSQPSDLTLQWNWTTNQTTLDLSFMGNATNGTATVSVMRDNETIYTATVGNVTEEKELMESAGNYTVMAELEAFVGSFHLAMMAVIEEPNETQDPEPSDDPDAEPTGSDDPETGEPESETQESPGVGILVVGLLGLLAVARRR